MPKRVTIPEGHIALIIPEQLAGELMSYMLRDRKAAQRRGETAIAGICGDVILALVEAQS